MGRFARGSSSNSDSSTGAKALFRVLGVTRPERSLRYLSDELLFGEVPLRSEIRGWAVLVELGSLSPLLVMLGRSRFFSREESDSEDLLSSLDGLKRLDLNLTRSSLLSGSS